MRLKPDEITLERINDAVLRVGFVYGDEVVLFEGHPDGFTYEEEPAAGVMKCEFVGFRPIGRYAKQQAREISGRLGPANR